MSTGSPLHTLLTPRRDWIAGDPALVDLVASTASYTGKGTGTDEIRAENAGKAYLALCLGLQEAGLLDLAHAPALWIDVGERAFKLCLSTDGDESSTAATSLSPSLTRLLGEFHVDSNPIESEIAEGTATHVTSAVPDSHGARDRQMVAFLKDLQLQLCRDGTDMRTIDYHSSELDRPPRNPSRSTHAQLESVDAIARIAECMRRLRGVEVQLYKISATYNVAYLAIGRAYSSAIGAIDHGPQGWRTSRAKQDVIWQKLATYRDLAYLASPNGQLAWTKRLQRAHKCCLLVDAEEVLQVVPAVSVSRVDRLSLYFAKGQG